MFWKKKDEQYYIDRAEECYNNHEYEDAIKFFQKAVKINSNNHITYTNMGVCYRGIGNNIKAL